MYEKVEQIKLEITVGEFAKLYQELQWQVTLNNQLSKDLAEARERIAELDAKITAKNK